MAEQTDIKINWYTLSPEEVGKRLQVDPAKGLSSDEAKARLQKYGPNRLAEKKKSGWQSFLGQYQNLMQFILLGAAIINQIFTGTWGTTLVLIGLTVFNAILGMRG
jgi:Ca2+-transporting ATPase